MRFYSVLLSTAFTLALHSAALAKPGKVGGEWTFASAETIEAGRAIPEKGVGQHDKIINGAMNKWLKHIAQRCGQGCRIVGNKIHVGQDFWFELHNDPWVIEVTAEAKDSDDLRRRELAAKYQDMIWESAAEVGLRPHARVGGGHMHFDIESHFGSNALLFRNFVVDLINHPELYMGILSLDYLNAPPLAIQKAEQRQALKALLRRFDEGKMTIKEFKTAMNSEVYFSTYVTDMPHPRYYPDKYQVGNLKHAETIEIRGNRPQTSFEHYMRLVDLFEKRIDYLAQFKTAIPYVEKDYSKLVAYKTVRSMEFYGTLVPVETILSESKRFIEETGLSWSRFVPVVAEEFKIRLKQEGKSHLLVAQPVRSCKALFAR